MNRAMVPRSPMCSPRIMVVTATMLVPAKLDALANPAEFARSFNHSFPWPPADGGHEPFLKRGTMKRIAMLLLIVVAAVVVLAQNGPNSAEVKLSPAERNIIQARKLIEKNPKDFEAYNALALALSRRARETADVAFYAQAEEALKNSFVISPDNFDGARIHAWLLLGKHEFASALEEATRLNKKMPDDIMVYGFLTDANVELGNYKAAEAAAQSMLDLRPGNLAGL